MPRIRGLLTISRRRWNLHSVGRGCSRPCFVCFGPWYMASCLADRRPCAMLLISFCAESVLIVVYTVNVGGINCYLYFFDFILLFFLWSGGPLALPVVLCRFLSSFVE